MAQSSIFDVKANNKVYLRAKCVFRVSAHVVCQISSQLSTCMYYYLKHLFFKINYTQFLIQQTLKCTITQSDFSMSVSRALFIQKFLYNHDQIFYEKKTKKTSNYFCFNFIFILQNFGLFLRRINIPIKFFFSEVITIFLNKFTLEK